MDLVDKVKSAGRKTALAFTLGSSLVLGGSGCALPAAAFIHGVAINNAAEKQAQATIKAAQIEADANQQQRNYVQQPIQPKSNNQKQNDFFTYRSFRGDLNNNGLYDKDEFIGQNEEEFEVDQNFGFGCKILNRVDATLTVTLYGWNRKISSADIKITHFVRSSN